MAHARRILLLICAALTLATAALWFRSNRVCDVFTIDGANGRHYEALCLANQIRVSVVQGWPVRQPPHYFQTSLLGYPVYGQVVLRPNGRTLGFATAGGAMNFWADSPAFPYGVKAARTTYRVYAVPLGAPILLFGAYPAWEVFVARRRRLRLASRIARGLCANCGYDLRGSPHRCPECGRVPPPGSTPATPPAAVA